MFRYYPRLHGRSRRKRRKGMYATALIGYITSDNVPHARGRILSKLSIAIILLWTWVVFTIFLQLRILNLKPARTRASMSKKPAIF